MELRLRFPQAEELQTDLVVDVSTQEEWQAVIHDRRPISSILSLKPPLFRPMAPAGSVCFKRRHAHEKNYVNNPARNDSYREAARRLAAKLGEAVGSDERVLVYAPLRGAGPIWRAVSRDSQS